MTDDLKQVIAAARQLSPLEQRQLINILSEALPQTYQPPPVTDMSQLAADFWPDDESADDIIEYIYSQREEDRQWE